MNPDSSDEMVDHLVDFFDRIAPVYDTWAGGQHARVAGRLVDLAAPIKHELVLDVGTGTGLVAHLVAPRVTRGRRPRPGPPRYSSDCSGFGEPAVLPRVVGAAGLDATRATAMVTGGRAKDARDWTELMAGAGPRPFTLIRSLGPRYRDELEAEVEAAMASLGDPDDPFRYHHSYVQGVATKR